MSFKGLIYKMARLAVSQPKQIVKTTIVTRTDSECFKNRNIVITGASRGIGYAIAKKIVNEGGNVLITSRNEQDLKLASQNLGSHCHYICYDTENVEKTEQFLAECIKEMGEIDTLILNAGISYHENNFLEVEKAGFEKQFAVNLMAPFFVAQSFLKYRLEQIGGKGNILFMSSETAAKSNDIPYGLTKAAINSLVGGLARRVVSKSIRVNAIAPGVTYTSMTAKETLSSGADIANKSAIGRYLLPEEIAEVACFMIRDESQCINGEVIYCDAGNHLKINGYDEEYSL